MTISCKQRAAAEACDIAVAVQNDSGGMEETTLLESKPGDVQFSKSKQPMCDTCIDGVDELRLEMHQKLQILEAGAKEATMREQSLVQQLYEARAETLAKSQEVSDLQLQLVQELRERQKVCSKVMEREREILRLLESPVGSKARASDAAQNLGVSKTAAESPSSLKVGSSGIADGVSRLVSHKSLPTLPKHDISPKNTPHGSWQLKEQSPQTNFRWQATTVATEPPSPSMLAYRSARAPLGQQRKLERAAMPTSPSMLGYRSPQAPLGQQFKLERATVSASPSMPCYRSPQAPLRQPFKFHVCEAPGLVAVPLWAQVTHNQVWEAK